MKILITGANGLLGQELLRQMAANAQFQVIATGKGVSRPALSDTVSYYEMDITIADKVFEVLLSNKPDVVIHAAAMTQVDDCETNKQQCYNTNVSATRFIIDACNEIKAKLIYISTDFVFDGLSGPYSEEDVPAPVNYYGSTKLAAENAVKEVALNWTIIRTVLVYGNSATSSRSNLVTWVKKNLEEGKPIRVVADQWRTPTFVEDLANGILLIILQQANGVYHLSGKDMLTPYDMAIKTASHFGMKKSLVEKVDATVFQQCGERPKKTGFIIEKAKKELGFEPMSFEDALKKMFPENRFKQSEATTI